MGSDPFRQKRLENATRQTCECLKLVLKEFFREEKKKNFKNILHNESNLFGIEKFLGVIPVEFCSILLFKRSIVTTVKVEKWVQERS